MATQTPNDVLLGLIAQALAEARKHGDTYASLHEGYGVLAEEIDELFDEIKLKAARRSAGRLIKESSQVAAVAMKIILTVLQKGVHP